MRQPIILSNNVDTTIKPPLSTAPSVVAAVAAAHRRLQEMLTHLQPGSLVLSLSAGVIYHRLLQRITECNGVPEVQTVPRKLGPDICVPYGKLLRGVIAVSYTHLDVYKRQVCFYTADFCIWLPGCFFRFRQPLR